jgi:transcriptional regulator with XRE-family HTH domain
MTMDAETVVELGRRLRSARLQLRRSQRSVGAAAAVSQPVISRMELGRGGGVPLATWQAVADVVGLRLGLAPVEYAEPDAGTG